MGVEAGVMDRAIHGSMTSDYGFVRGGGFYVHEPCGLQGGWKYRLGLGTNTQSLGFRYFMGCRRESHG